MLNTIKNYELNNDISIELLQKAEFTEGGVLSSVESPKMRFFKPLYKDIEIWIEIPIKDLENIKFNELENVVIMDSTYHKTYYPFYESNKHFPFLDKVISEYNKLMDSLVEKKILKERTLETTKEDIIDKVLEDSITYEQDIELGMQLIKNVKK